MAGRHVHASKTCSPAAPSTLLWPRTAVGVMVACMQLLLVAGAPLPPKASFAGLDGAAAAMVAPTPREFALKNMRWMHIPKAGKSPRVCACASQTYAHAPSPPCE